MALIDTIEEITHFMDEKKHAVGVFLDLKKAFDAINHILLNKLEWYGMRGRVLDWVRSYLCSRKQYVHLGEHCSGCLGVGCWALFVASPGVSVGP